MNMNELAKDIHANAVRHGWWDKPLTDAEIRCLIHSEWSEALEEYRAGRPMVWHGEDGKPEGIAVELIDGCIRILDCLGYLEADLSKIKGITNLVCGIYHKPDHLEEMPLSDLLDKLHRLTAEDGPFVSAIASCVGITCSWIECQGLDPEALILEKHEYNKTRPYRHGGKKL